jgi:hypothetical protein
MGYEIRLLIGKSCLHGDELARDRDHPFEDGSGFPYLKDKKGEYVKTGRKQAWFQIMAEVEMCKLGYQNDALNNLIDQVHSEAKAKRDKEMWYIYGLDGNTQFDEDRHGDALRPTPIKDVLKAAKASLIKKEPYRRLVWAIALLKSMADDAEGLEVIFWGH